MTTFPSKELGQGYQYSGLYTNYEKPDQIDFHPCMFPMLGDEDSGNATCSVQDIDAVDVRAITFFCDQGNTDIYTFFTAIWSLVLHQFTEIDDVHFGVVVKSSSASAWKKPSELVGEGKNICAIQIDPDQSIGELLDIKTFSVLANLPARSIQFNSAVVFSENTFEQDIETLLAETSLAVGIQNDQVSIGQTDTLPTGMRKRFWLTVGDILGRGDSASGQYRC